jgi:polar amino acid transport system permease protein
MNDFTFWDIAQGLLLSARWTVLLSLIAFVGGGAVGLTLLVLKLSCGKRVQAAIKLYVEIFQGTPLLMQLFLGFFGLPLLGIEVSPWLAASVALTLNTAAYLYDIWRGCVEAIPRAQWQAAASLGLTHGQQLRYVIWPQARRIAIAPTVGFLVQVVKSTALASIIGFSELTRVGNMLTNVVFQPFMIYSLVAALYFVLCFPLTWYARVLERRQSLAFKR